MKVGTVRLSDVQKFGRWDAAFHIAYAENAAVCDRLMAAHTEAELHKLITAMPCEDRRLFNALVSKRCTKVNETSVKHLKHAAAAVYLAELAKQFNLEAELCKVHLAANAQIQSLRDIQAKLTPVIEEPSHDDPEVRE